MRNQPYIDLFVVPPQQSATHERLENWARWVVPGYPMKVSPMFRLTRSNSRQWHEPVLMPSVDSKDAILVERTISKMPPKHAAVLRWYYVAKSGEKQARRILGVTRAGLFQLVCDARQMLQTTCKSY